MTNVPKSRLDLLRRHRRKAISVNARDAAFRFRAAELWNQLNLRGMAMMNMRNGSTLTNVRVV